MMLVSGQQPHVCCAVPKTLFSSKGSLFLTKFNNAATNSEGEMRGIFLIKERLYFIGNKDPRVNRNTLSTRLDPCPPKKTRQTLPYNRE